MSAVSTSNTALIAAAKRYGAERDINPYIALLEEVRRTAGHVAWLGWKVESAPDDDSLLTTHLSWLKLYHAEREKLVKVCETAVRLGLEERVVRMEERKAELMARAFIGALEELGLPPEYMERAPAALRRQLLAIEAQSTEG